MADNWNIDDRRNGDMRAEKYGIDCSRGVRNRGNLYRIERVMKKAMRGEDITVGFLGGSITQGCL